jgi:hypothetical protein
LLSDDFAQTGIEICPPPAGGLTQFQVLGERSSGTNLMQRLMTRNSGLRPSEALGWKHGFAQMLAIPADLLVVCMVRDPAAWALSMHAKPWHTSPAMQKLGFSEFIRAPWDTAIDRPRYFKGAREAGLVGQVLQQDRDPVTGARFANLFALRRRKLQNLLSFPDRDCACVVVRTEALQAAPEMVLRQIIDGASLPGPEGAFRGVFKRLGSKFKPAVAERPATPTQISPEDQAFLWSQLDRATEAALGYGPDHGDLKAGE